MTRQKFESHLDLARSLVDLFPDLERGMEADEPVSHHDVLMTFAPRATELLESSGEKGKRRFCELVNDMVEAGGVAENAISTCFLEHASQIGVRKLIKPYLSAAAKSELR